MEVGVILCILEMGEIGERGVGVGFLKGAVKMISKSAFEMVHVQAFF